MAPFDIDGFSFELPEWASSFIFPEPEKSDPFPLVPVAAAFVIVALVGTGLLFYFKKRKH
jgi:LPXTG-motif cell wall-anchored protein